MNCFWKRSNLAQGILVSLAFAAMVPACLAADAKVNGFLGTIVDAKIIPGSAPDSVEPVANTQTPRDSLDLTLMANWSLNYLTCTVTIENNFASSYSNWPLNMPPFAVGGDIIAIGDSEVRNLLAFVLMRKMSGVDDGANVQKGVMERVLGYQHPRGLFTPPVHADTDVLWATAWATRALIEDFATTGNHESMSRAEKALKAVRQYAVKSNGHGLLWLDPPKEITLDGKVIDFDFRPGWNFCIVEPFVRYYEVTGDKSMLAIAKGLVDGRLEKFSQHDSSHTHGHWHSVIPVAHLGAVTGEAKYLDWAEDQLNRWSSMRTDYGWFEAIGGYGASETCAVADLLHVCVYLARGGRTTHYDLVERTLRNYLPQEQFFVADEGFMAIWQRQNYKNRDRHMALLHRMEGGFLWRTTPTDRWAENTISLEGCCPPTGMTALYVAWTDIVRKTDKEVFVMPQIVFSQAVQAGYVFSDWKVTDAQLSATMIWNGKFFGGSVPKYRLLDADGKELSGDAMVSIADNGKITATVEMPLRNPPKSVLLRLRHPKALPIKSVMLNGNRGAISTPQRRPSTCRA